VARPKKTWNQMNAEDPRTFEVTTAKGARIKVTGEHNAKIVGKGGSYADTGKVNPDARP
jgi:hypothetical protein